MSFLRKFSRNKTKRTRVFDFTLPGVRKAFGVMERDAGWDISQKLYWSYYFLDSDLQKLERFGKRLELIGFDVVEVRSFNREHLFLFHIEEYDTHSAETLLEQCHNLARISRDEHIENFEGWDVEQRIIVSGYR